MIDRGEKNAFQFATVGGAAINRLMVVSSANNHTYKDLYVTDLNVTGAGRLVLKTPSCDLTKAIDLTFPSDTTSNFTFNVPYKISIVSSTGETRPIVASCAVGYQFLLTGYTETRQ